MNFKEYFANRPSLAIPDSALPRPAAGGPLAAKHMNEQVILAFSSCPDETSAATIAKALVEAGLAACVSRIPSMQSTYVWDGVLKEDAEVLLIIKTVASALPALTARLTELHPYDLPELVGIAAAGGNEPYLQWVRRCAGAQGS